jgi:hypothetical protein
MLSELNSFTVKHLSFIKKKKMATKTKSPYLLYIVTQKKSVNILHLDGRRFHVECDPGKTRINQLMQVTYLFSAEYFEGVWMLILFFRFYFRSWWITSESRPVTPYFLAYLVSKAAISYSLDLTTKSAVWRLTTINNCPIPASTFTSDSGFMFTLFSLCSKSWLNANF